MFSNPFFLIYIVSTVIVILIIWIVRLEVKLRKLLSGKDGKSLEDAIVKNKESIALLETFQKECVGYFKNIENRLKRSIQAVETIRFNPFKGTGEGGNQSFATSFLSERGDGVVVSSLYSRDRVSVFSKPLASFKSTFDLTEEESTVIDSSKKKLS